jgi:aryl-alcohol dehydrogenase-like predicted oxidoreductase
MVPHVEIRSFRRWGRDAGVIGLGTWQLGADWGAVSEDEAHATLQAAYDSGVTFFDTADVYGDGRSEQFLGSFRTSHPDITIATKMGRRVPQEPANYSLDNFRAWNDRSRANLGVETLDLVQLHCPPTPVFSSDAVYDALDTMVQEKRIGAYGVSVERVDEALAAIARPNVVSVQIILNALRLKPLDQVLPAAAAAGVGIIARVPLASGLLSGRYDENTTFAENDHRNYNRHGEAFDVGETFSGVDYETGLEAVRRLRPLVPGLSAPSAGQGAGSGTAPQGASMAQFALRWVLDQPGVTVVIPGARNPAQAQANAAAAELAPLPAATVDGVREIYDELIRPQIHNKW